MIPNLEHNALDVAKIVIDDDDSPRLVPLCVLNLPPIARGASLLDFYCRAEPNPTSSGHVAIPPPSGRPFHDKAEDAIMIFDISYGHWCGEDRLTFIVHRRALLTLIPPVHRACIPFSSALEPPPTLVRVPWSAWGPAATRWFEGDDSSMGRIMKTAGQRAVTLEDSMPAPIIVRDFNPYAVRAVRAIAAASGQSQQGNWSEQLPNGNRMTLKVEDSVIPVGLIFEEDVRSSLPYIEIVTQDEYHYDRAMIDDQRILCLKVRSGSLCRCIGCIESSSFYRVAKKTGSGLGLLTFTCWVNELTYPGSFVMQCTSMLKLSILAGQEKENATLIQRGHIS